MKLAAAVTLVCAGACAAPAPGWYEARQSPTPKDLAWHTDVLVLDALTTAADTVADLHRADKRAVCRLGPIRPSDPDAGRRPEEAYRDRLRLCRDKGFDAVTFHTPNADLAREAARLDLPVLNPPSDSAGRRTTTGS